MNAFTEKNDDSEAVRQWLTGPDGQRVLKKCARDVYYRAVSRRLSPCFLHLTDLPQPPPPSDILDDIRSELTAFLLSRPGLIREITSPDLVKKSACLSTAFTRHWIDNTRNLQDDPMRYLRKRLTDLFRLADDITTRQFGRQMVYAVADTPANPAHLTSEDLNDIPLPGTYAGPQVLKNGKTLLALARWFWEQVCEIWGRPMWTDIRHLVLWLARHFPQERVRVADLPDDRTLADTSRPPSDPENIIRQAARCAESLPEKQARALFLRYGREMNYHDMAREMGYASPSSAQNHLNAGEQALGRLLRDRRWLSPDDPNGDPNPEAFTLFFEKLMEELEKRTTAP